MSRPTMDQTEEPRSFYVTGHVLYANGFPAYELKVVAFDRDLRTEQRLGYDTTDREGAYKIEYSQSRFINQERGTADLVVKVFDSEGDILVASPILFNAPQNAEIDLTIPMEKQEPPALFDRIKWAVGPLIGRVSIEKLEEDQQHQDLTFLAGETGFEKSVLARFVLAHLLTRIGIETEFWFALLGGSFFSYAETESIEANHARVKESLPAIDAIRARKALVGSFNKREIDTALQGKTDAWIEMFLTLAADLVLGDAKSPTFIRLALDQAGIVSADKRSKIARLLNQYKMLTPDALSALKKDRSFKKAEVADLSTSYKLAELTTGDFSVAKMLKDEFNLRRPEQIRTLAKHSEREWVELIERKHKAGEIKIPLFEGSLPKSVRLPDAELYAKVLESRFREAYPTAAFAGGLEHALVNGGARGIPHARDLTRIIERHQDFDLLRTPVDDFLKKGLRAEFRGLAGDETFRLELKAVQRVFKLAPTFEATNQLLADRLHSAQMIYRMGESSFVRRYGERPGFTAESARLAWNRAADTHAAVLTVIGDLAGFDSGILPGILKSSHPDLKLFPNWENLFQAGDICHCEHCRSVLSPAAYFADLLMFLGDRKSSKPDVFVKDILFERRSDLGYLELNCDNALTSLPYVDVVCEVLERVVADSDSDIELAGLYAIPAGTAAGKAAVAAALSAQKINVGANFTLSQVDPDHWVVHGDEAAYLLKKEATANFFAELIPNTKASSEELRAYPAYVNSAAYKKLKTVKYPLTVPLDLFEEGDTRRIEQRSRSFSLPFDLFAEEVRAGFQKSNLKRWDLMRTFQVAPNDPTDVQIAAEYFGISCDDEETLIFQERMTNAGQQEVWGETGNGNWLSLNASDNSLCVVKYFLNKTGLEYNELLALLDLPFINPTKDIYIEHLDSSCDTEQKLIHGFTTGPNAPRLEHLDRIHRFLRLWRKLSGWKMWELDLALRCHGIGHLGVQGNWLIDDDPVLLSLYYLDRLRKRLGVKTSIEELCGLFNDLNFEKHFSRPQKKRIDGLYQNLFLNRKLVQPLDPAFEIDLATKDIRLPIDPNTGLPILDPQTGKPVPSKISDHQTPLLAALGVREKDFIILKSLTKASSGIAYINDDLTLANVSFIWRHSWLAKRLKFKADEWKTVLKLLHQDIAIFTDPKAAFEFVEKIDLLKATGFTPDELNWLLVADRLAQAALKEVDAARFLDTLRKELQAIKKEYDPDQYPYLSPPRDVESLDTLLKSILQKLNRSETEVNIFLKALRGPVVLEANVQDLGMAFAFPPAIIGPPNYIPIRLEWVLRFQGLMTPTQHKILLTDPSLAAVTALPAYMKAIDDLFLKQSGQVMVTGLPPDFAFPATIIGKPNSIPIRFQSVLRFNGIMTDAQRTSLLSGVMPAAVANNSYYKKAIEDLFQQSAAAGESYLTTEVTSIQNSVTLPLDQPSIPIRYNPTTQKLSFTGVMSDTELAALKASGNDQKEMDALFWSPRLAVKFFEPVFTAELEALPAVVDFQQLSADLAEKITYDAEQRLLRYTGFMSETEKDTLINLVPPAEGKYRNAVYTVFSQPQTIMPPDNRIWLMYGDIDPMQKPDSTLAGRLANAAEKGLHYLSETVATNYIVSQCSPQLGLAAALTRRLLKDFRIIPAIPPGPKDTLLTHFTRDFAPTGGVVGHQSPTMNGWFWLNRAAAILKKWKLTAEEFDKIINLTVGAQLLDLLTLPLTDSDPIAPLDCFLRTCRLLRIKDALPEEKISFLGVLEKLSSGFYAAIAAQNNPPTTEKGEFAKDVEKLNIEWSAVEMGALIDSLDLAFPGDYYLAEKWERIQRAFSFIKSLNAGAETVKKFAAAIMTDTHAKILKELLRSKFGSDIWLTLSAEIQDALRERKRDALIAYLLAVYPVEHPNQPDISPSRKWENANDLYAYYLLDVEMGSFQLTSRLVQASGSVQLFVQRCSMGVEPDVKVQVDGPDGESAWRWWKWMSKYRVWEANRKVFLWPENWIEPELKKDRSYFFKELENELLQNELNQYTAETAFTNYLEKLTGIAQLEVSNFFQEDDGDNTIIHVFGRTTGAEPYQYYYRRYDYLQWTPWEKIDLDIQGDYLVPAVINKRLFLFWPIFTEAADEAANQEVEVPKIEIQESSQPPQPSQPSKFTPQPVKKKLRLQMAVSEYRQGKWTQKKISKDFLESEQYFGEEIIKSQYRFWPVDRSEKDRRFGIVCQGNSVGQDQVTSKARLPNTINTFEISGRNGAPEKTEDLYCPFNMVLKAEDTEEAFLKWLEKPNIEAELTIIFAYFYAYPGIFPAAYVLQSVTNVLDLTPGRFYITFPWHESYFDRAVAKSPARYQFSGTWLPFFYHDKTKTFFVRPSITAGNDLWYYPEVKKTFRFLESILDGLVSAWVDTLTPVQEKWLEAELKKFPNVPPTYTAKQILAALIRMHLFTFWYQVFQTAKFQFKNFYHPFVHDFANLVCNPLQGIPALMSRETQLKNSGFDFIETYHPPMVMIDQSGQSFYPEEIVDFSSDGAYSPYNWELFFHAPLLIANMLSRNQRFEEARDWYHFIFNPIGVESCVAGGSEMSKYWITKPFFKTTDPKYVEQRIENLLRLLSGDKTAPGYSEAMEKELQTQVTDWRNNPFEPHRIANYRTVAYQKTVVIKYLDNLIAWGDYLFRQDSMESINEATQLYILAAELLGPRPKMIPPQVQPPVESFKELETKLDDFADALVQVENLIPMQPGTGQQGINTPPLPMFYFCIPYNEKLLSYYDTIADRLYKIRHGMTIEGVQRQLALFEPPIEPGALVKAIAAGVDISAAIADLNTPLPFYRFNGLLQKANEVCNDVKALGAALLSALEKKDAEALNLLRQGQELRLLKAVRDLRKKQIEEAKENLESLKRSKAVTEEKRNHYRDFEKIIAGEQLSLTQQRTAFRHQQEAQSINVTASMLGYLPNLTFGVSGFGGSPHVNLQWGINNVISALQALAGSEIGLSNAANFEANTALTLAGYTRRFDDAKFQERVAEKEISQVEKQIAAAELRLAIANKELENHDLQIENSKAIDAYMRSKYTNEELYQWQIGQISGLYFQNYKLAYDLAKRAERCFRFELGLQDSNFISFGYWDSLKKGLLSGEQLQYDLRRLEVAYLEQNRREFELIKHISLIQLDPLAMVRLRETGRCFFRLPEELFDLDYPGHYFRRIKTVSLTLPCVTGPYTTISCTLRLLKNSIRIDTANGDDGYPRNTDETGLPADDTRFVENNIPVKSIAASSGQNDSGVFELNFRDERYLPFEGAGSISEWSIELFNDLPANNPDPTSPDFGKPLRQFDYNSITDAILHVRYTAREDSGVFKNAAIVHLRDYFSEDGTKPSLLMLSLRRDFPSEWSRFITPMNSADGNVLKFDVSPKLFPLRDAGKALKITALYLFARCTPEDNYEITLTPPLSAQPPAGAKITTMMTLAKSNTYGGLHVGTKTAAEIQKEVANAVFEVDPIAPAATWLIKVKRQQVSGELGVEDVVIVLEYVWV